MQMIAQLENAQVEITPLNMYNKFVERIRRNLHVVLAFSPIGDAFRNRLRMFPSLINCCTINWFKVRLRMLTMGLDFLGSSLQFIDHKKMLYLAD